MNIEATIKNRLGENWGLILALGIILLILGSVGIGATFAVTLVTVTFFGYLILVGSVLQLLDAFRYKGWAFIGNIFIAMLYVSVGYMMIKNPMLASSTITLFIACALIAIGIMRLMVAFRLSGVPGWIWTLISGLAAIVIGTMILNDWPESGLWVIGMFIAIELIFNGWGLIMLGLAARRIQGSAVN